MPTCLDHKCKERSRSSRPLCLIMDILTQFESHFTTQQIVSSIQASALRQEVSMMAKLLHTSQHISCVIDMANSMLTEKISVPLVSAFLSNAQLFVAGVLSCTRTMAKIFYDSALSPGHSAAKWPLRENQFLSNQESKYAR